MPKDHPFTYSSVMRKYDIFLARFTQTKGSVQHGIRPCVIIQSNLFNAHSPTVLVAPLTSTLKSPFPSEFIITPSATNGLSKPSRFLGSQIITIPSSLLEKKLGVMEPSYFPLLQEALITSLDLNNLFLDYTRL